MSCNIEKCVIEKFLHEVEAKHSHFFADAQIAILRGTANNFFKKAEANKSTKDLQVFKNDEINANVRVIEKNGEYWFVAKDVCDALGIQNSRDTIAKLLDDDEKGVASIYTLGGPQQINIVNEPGLYKLIFGSRKPEAKAFKRWVTHEVLPSTVALSTKSN